MSLRDWSSRVALTWLLLATFAASAFAAPGVNVAKKSNKKPKAEAEKKADDFKPWSEVTKGTDEVAGFFTLYRKPDKLYLAIAEDQLDKDFLGIASIARGIGTNWLLGGLPLSDRLLAFHRIGNRIMLLDKNTRFTAPAGSAFERAVELSHGNSVLYTFSIESINDESKAILVDATPLLVSDLEDFTEYFRQAFSHMTVRFDKERSALTSVKNFPDNLEIEALLTFTPNPQGSAGGGPPRWVDDPLESVPDNRYIPLTVHYSFSRLPEVPMQPRLSDDRVGQFLTAIKDFSKDRNETYWMRYVDRWRLEKQDPSAAVSEPVKPIVWYIDRTVPEEYRPTIKHAIENWQKAFEAAGFKNAIIAKDAPDDPNWDAEDVRYSTIRWIVSDRRLFGAIGPSRRDPRTGEILDADVLIEGGMIQAFRNAYRSYVTAAALAENVVPSAGILPGFEHLRCTVQDGVADGGALMRIALQSKGLVPPGGPVPDAYVDEALTWVVMHEVGHSLGLEHNFRSSTATPMSDLQVRDYTAKHGLTASVMDYAAPNVAFDGTQGEYYGSCVGDYDVWAIRYAYTPSGEKDIDADYAFAKKIADESLMPGHDYGSDYDAYPANALDPRVNTWDLGDDPLAYGKAMAGYIQGLWSSDGFEQKILGKDGPYSTLRGAVNVLLGQYGRAVGLTIKYIGGQYFERVHRGQPGAVDPLRPVDAAIQRDAEAFLGERVFSADAFQMSPQLLNRLAPERWDHWGTQSFYDPNARVDYNLRERVFAIQNAVLNAITAPKLLARLSEAENRTADPFTLAEHFATMTKSLWGEVGPVLGPGMRALGQPNTRRQLQRAYVDRLAQIMLAPAPGTPDDARALARLQLVRIDDQAQRALTAAGLNDEVRAHLLDSRARIKQSLEAQRSAGDGRGGVPAIDE